MTVRLGIVMDPIEKIHFKKDSSLAMLLAAQKRGWQIEYMELPDLYLKGGQARARTRDLTVHLDPEDWFSFGGAQERALGDLDVILMRQDPPVDREFLMATFILEIAEQQGALVVNPASTLRDCNEKLFAAQFEDCTPPLIVTRSAQRLKEFYAEHGDVIMKPVDGMGGRSIFRVKENDDNLGVIIETLTNHGAHQAMAQCSRKKGSFLSASTSSVTTSLKSMSPVPPVFGNWMPPTTSIFPASCWMPSSAV